MLPLNQPIDVLFEFINDVTGAAVVTPVTPKLYVVRPGATIDAVAELVAGAVFEQVNGAFYRTVIPAEYVDSSGILTAFSQSDGALSRTFAMLEVDGGAARAEETFVPFSGRTASWVPKVDVVYSGVVLAVSNASGSSSRAVAATEFVQLLDYASQPLPFYLVKLLSSEVEAGLISYIAKASGMVDYGGGIHVEDPGSAQFTVVLDPALPAASVEFLQESTTPVISVLTDPDGTAQVLLPVGAYTVRLRKTGFVFNVNNVAIDTDNILDEYLPLDATSTQEPAVSAGFCRITFKLLDPTGQPIKNLKVRFFPQLNTSGGAGIVRQALEVVTNANGEGELHLIHGLSVKVSVEGTRIAEEFTVPATNEENLFDLISFVDKGFSTYVGNFEDGIRRTLV